PVERDAAGHLQRRPPAVLAAWDERHDRLDHYAWGVTGELAERMAMTLGDFERDQRERQGVLAQLATGGVVEPDALHRALRDFAHPERH
ncbi:MAG: hypothetical protein M3253_06445, partial [Chloroflexota bacterium]|nr:hypothetical protein [Chloroflexota bacterium]